MEAGSGERLSSRGRRAVAVIGIAVVAIVVTGVVYLRPELSRLGKTVGAHIVAPVTTPTPPLLPDIYSAAYDFVNQSTGWAMVGEQLPTPRFWVFKTTDGAKHWMMELTGTLTPPVQVTLQPHFFDADHGVVSIGDPAQVFRTDDGGGIWTPIALPTMLSDAVEFSDPHHGWIIGYAGSQLQPENRVYSTADGGDTWARLPALPSFLAGGKDGSFSADFAFRSPSEGWLGGLTQVPTVFSTIDGGATWQPHRLPLTGPQPPNGKAFASDTSVYPILGAGVMAITFDENANPVGFTSFDGGSTWRRLPPPPGETSFDRYVFQDTFHWWAMRYGTLFKSSDAGQSWKETAQQMDEWDYAPQVIDAKHAWAQMLVVFPNANPPRGTGLAVTTDGGVRWTPVNVPRPG